MNESARVKQYPTKTVVHYCHVFAKGRIINGLGAFSRTKTDKTGQKPDAVIASGFVVPPYRDDKPTMTEWNGRE
jgi:hypothetical protein